MIVAIKYADEATQEFGVAQNFIDIDDCRGLMAPLVERQYWCRTDFYRLGDCRPMHRPRHVAQPIKDKVIGAIKVIVAANAASRVPLAHLTIVATNDYHLAIDDCRSALLQRPNQLRF